MSPRTKRLIQSPVLHESRPVGAELVIQHRDGPLVGQRSEHGAADVAGQQLPSGEHQNAQDEERHQRVGDAADQELQDGVASLSSAEARCAGRRGGLRGSVSPVRDQAKPALSRNRRLGMGGIPVNPFLVGTR